MGRLTIFLRIVAGGLVAAVWCATARPQTMPGETRITHPNGAAIVVRGVAARDDSISLTATIANPGERELRLDKSRSFVLEGAGHAMHYLNPPLGNPELSIPPRSQLAAELVFIGPLVPGTRELQLSINQGIGTADNPYDDAPALRATLGVDAQDAAPVAGQANHPAGVTLRLRRLAAGGGSCVASVDATNGNDRTIVLNHAGGMVLSVVLLGLALRDLPVGTGYAVWTGIGTVGTALVGIWLFNEPATALRLGSIALIVVGIAGLKFLS